MLKLKPFAFDFGIGSILCLSGGYRVEELEETVAATLDVVIGAGVYTVAAFGGEAYITGYFLTVDSWFQTLSVDGFFSFDILYSGALGSFGG